MYGLSKRMLTFLCTILAAFLILSLVVANEIYAGLKGLSNNHVLIHRLPAVIAVARPLAKVPIYVCSASYTSLNPSTTFFVATLAVEATLFVTALLKCMKLSSGRSAISIMRRGQFLWDILFRDTLIYFFVLSFETYWALAYANYTCFKPQYIRSILGYNNTVRGT